MTRIRSVPAVLLAASALALTGCSGPTEEAPEEAPAQQPTATVSPGEVLYGTLGTPEDPEAYEMALTDEDGVLVTSVPAGEYTVMIRDASSLHNFVLLDPDGEVLAETPVGGSDEVTLELRLEAGTYDYYCAPHSTQMRGAVEVV